MEGDPRGTWRDEAHKARYVRDMFAGVASRYDLLNTILSFNRHRAWRRLAVRLASLRPGDAALDVCTGTADLALDLRRAVGPGGFVVGVDFCAPMLVMGGRKVSAEATEVALLVGDALQLPFRPAAFDCATVGFGIRNVSDVGRALKEMARVLKPGGRVVCLEFCVPRSPVWRPLVSLYQNRVLPRIGGMLSRREAYAYLPASIEAFHSREELCSLMRDAGLTNVQVRDLNFGSVCIHTGTKP